MKNLLIYFVLWMTFQPILAQELTQENSTFFVNKDQNFSCEKENERISTTSITALDSVKTDSTQQSKDIIPDLRRMTYYFASSAFHPKVGKIYLHNKFLLINSVEFGIHRNFSVNAGFEIISMYALQPVFYIKPKYSIPVHQKLRIGASVTGLFISNQDNRGLVTGFLTYGTPQTHITGTAGYSSEYDKIVYNLSGNIRIHPKIGLISENWFMPQKSRYSKLSLFGFRWISPNMTVDLALATGRFPSWRIHDVDYFIPYFGFSIEF